MDKELNKKIITVSFAAAAALTAVVIRVLMQTTAASFGAVQRLWAQEWFQHGIPVAIALVLFFFLQFNKKILVWADEVVSELLKVVWPSRKDTTAMTIVTCVMLMISASLLFVFDIVSRNITQMLFALGRMVS
ncbi:MAG: preprotein translocase subunit SecE [Bdellovibrionales bacterium]|nr:preprotein translocase subunit SecE [Bdellovibrionales bacterium]